MLLRAYRTLIRAALWPARSESPHASRETRKSDQQVRTSKPAHGAKPEGQHRFGAATQGLQTELSHAAARSSAALYFNWVTRQLPGSIPDRAEISRWSQWACGVASGLDPFENGCFVGLAPQGSKPVAYP